MDSRFEGAFKHMLHSGEQVLVPGIYCAYKWDAFIQNGLKIISFTKNESLTYDKIKIISGSKFHGILFLAEIDER